jgi:hypothetical protein
MSCKPEKKVRFFLPDDFPSTPLPPVVVVASPPHRAINMITNTNPSSANPLMNQKNKMNNNKVEESDCSASSGSGDDDGVFSHLPLPFQTARMRGEAMMKKPLDISTFGLDLLQEDLLLQKNLTKSKNVDDEDEGPSKLKLLLPDDITAAEVVPLRVRLIRMAFLGILFLVAGFCLIYPPVKYYLIDKRGYSTNNQHDHQQQHPSHHVDDQQDINKSSRSRLCQ